ncbi:MAG TPA: hypothetical protein VMZ03_13770, partial [Chitinophagaceae bacterium]|nr:hypothetical protein [Chitinophagaceae bacterium]
MINLRRGKCLLLLVYSVLTGVYGLAQKPEQELEKWAQKNPIEKVYLHFDRENYIAGETAWFKAYLSSDHFPDTLSTTLYVELVNSDLAVVERKIVPVILATSYGQIDFADSLVSGMYTIRAFTRSMFDQSQDFI